ncbi:MAG: hypothetical protein M1834_006007 [Cirrosporium novae-zelandiae]|nr:MAG: hypothetical protein M1834_006007 [Cirrosporium novae-zelandiae]
MTSFHAVPSSNGAFIAIVEGPKLYIRSTEDRNIIRTIDLGESFIKSLFTIRWFKPHSTAQEEQFEDLELALDDEELFDDRSRSQPQRILLANEDTVRVWDTHNASWNVAISNAGGPVGKVGYADFGHNEDTVLIFSAFKVRLLVCSLKTGRSFDIRDPKFTSKGFGYRPGSNHMALLTRPATYDIATLHEPDTLKQWASFDPSTVDAQGLKWSHDGKWLAIWDSPTYGYRLSIHAADGNLFRTYNGDEEDDGSSAGIQCIQWGPKGDYLAIGGSSMRVTLLSCTTFSPKIYLEHTTTVKLPDITIWQEQLLPGNGRSYVAAPQPLCPPTAQSLSESDTKIGISLLAFNHNGSLLATRTDAMPTTLWIWSLKSLAPKAILVHHAPVRNISWHPKQPDLIMFQCANKDPAVYHWNSKWEAPKITTVPLDKPGGRQEEKWIRTGRHQRPLFLYGNARNFVIGQIQEEGKEPIFFGEPQKSPSPGRGSSMSNRSKPMNGTSSKPQDITDAFDETLDWIEGADSSGSGNILSEVEDTFQFRKHIPVP